MLHYYLSSDVCKGQTSLTEYKGHCPESLVASMVVNEHGGCSKEGKNINSLPYLAGSSEEVSMKNHLLYKMLLQNMEQEMDDMLSGWQKVLLVLKARET